MGVSDSDCGLCREKSRGREWLHQDGLNLLCGRSYQVVIYRVEKRSWCPHMEKDSRVKTHSAEASQGLSGALTHGISRSCSYT